MASTRNKNTPINYNLEQRQYALGSNYTLYANSQYGTAYNPRLAGDGFMPGQVPWNELSNNAADTESFLLGIGLTNLVNPMPTFVPDSRSLDFANAYEKNMTVLMPEPLVLEKGQRPMRY